MLRAAIYSRYSSENQREASIEEQLEVCRRYIDRQGWQLVETYTDAAISGASKFRPSYTRLISDAEAGKFEVIVSEALDRLSRNLSDTASLYDRLKFSRVLLHTTSMGLISDLHIGIMGTMAQMTLTDLGNKVRRGQLGRARQGKIPGGLAFGYTVVPPAPWRQGGRRPVYQWRQKRRSYRADFSRVCRRMVAPAELPNSSMARAFGALADACGVDTTIRGQGDRGTGPAEQYALRRSTFMEPHQLHQEPGYRPAGRPRQQRTLTERSPRFQSCGSLIKHYGTLSKHGRRPPVTPSVTRRRATTPAGGYRSRFLLSGLLTCGCCGGGYTIIGKDRYGCATRRGKGTCDNSRSISRQHIEARVLSGLRERMLTP